MFITACSISSSSGDRQSTGHSIHDQSTSNGNGTSAVTLGNFGFTTSQFNFIDDGSASATSVQLLNPVEYNIGSPVSRFGIDNQYMFAYVENSAFDTELISYSLKERKVVSTKKPDNFYHVASVNGSIFIGDMFMDHDQLYVKDQFDLLTIPISDNTNIQTLTTINTVEWRFTADNQYVYIAAVGEVGILDTEIHRIDKSNSSIINFFTIPVVQAGGIEVDSNHLYVSSKDDNKVYVYKVNDDSALGSIEITVSFIRLFRI